MKTRKILALILALVMVLGLFAGCGAKEETAAPAEKEESAAPAEKEEAPATSESGRGSGDVYKIGLDCPMTGNCAGFGEQMSLGAQMAVDQINEAGQWACDAVRLGVENEVPPVNSVQVENEVPPVNSVGRISAVLSASARCSMNIDAAAAPVVASSDDGMPQGAVGFSRLGVENEVPPVNSVHWWNQNWRKGGLQERRLEIIRQYDFYNQQYCGCEFSMRKPKED